MYAPPSSTWPTIPAESLEVVREPAADAFPLGPRCSLADIVPTLRNALVGCYDRGWDPPDWLMPHQRDAARRVSAALTVFRGAVLADAVGLGKSYVALAVAQRHPSCTVVAPATLVPQWRRLAHDRGVAVTVLSHEALSRGTAVPQCSLVVVDEAHRFRNPATNRYDRLARDLRRAAVLLVSATPVVNRVQDLVHLLRLFLPDSGLAAFGVPSLEAHLAHPDPACLLRAVGPVVIARAAASVAELGPIPTPVDAPVCETGTVPPRPLARIVAEFDRLRFPSFGPDASALLRQHVLYRLASSVAACRVTLRRHLRYVDRAIAAATRGEALPRGTAAALFDAEDAAQLELGLAWYAARPALDARYLQRERTALERVLRVLPADGCDPKADELVQLVGRRRRRKTLVFTAAEATAFGLARRLGWEQVAVVAAGRSRVASGPIAAEEAFSLFAPRARGREAPSRALTVSVLIATDLASEGLDLQDADAVVHYDLPWTPVRLEQRLGRIARLGSHHARVDVLWFAPPPIIEERLRLRERIAAKVDTQLRVAVTRSSLVGRTRVLSRVLLARERLAHVSAQRVHGYAVVHGPPELLCALRWRVGNATVRELVQSAPDPCRDRLLAGRERHDGVPFASRARLVELLRERVINTCTGPAGPTHRRLTAGILARGRRAARERDRSMIDLLDRTLRRLERGVAVGRERRLSDVLAAGVAATALKVWLRETPSQPVWHGPHLEAALLGTGGVALDDH
ncbi:MAG TPA: DEAD/DEAH box helicase [Gemmatimonadales bacterium]